MQLFTLAVVAALAAVSSAQSLNNLPPCAQSCVGNSLSTTGCNIIDISCICKSSGWIAGLSCCISQKCSQADQATTIQFAGQICQVAGVTLPSQATCASGAASTPAPTSTDAAASGASSVMNSGSMGTTAASVSGTTTAAPVPGTTTASAGAVSTAGAAHMIGQGMGVAGAAVAALAFL